MLYDAGMPTAAMFGPRASSSLFFFVVRRSCKGALQTRARHLEQPISAYRSCRGVLESWCVYKALPQFPLQTDRFARCQGGRMGSGIHNNVNQKNERSQVRRKRLRVEKRKHAGARLKHVEAVRGVAGPARTGKAARKQIKLDRRLAKEALVRLCLFKSQPPDYSTD